MANLTDQVVKFRDARNWAQFHNPKDCAISLQLEATEVLEHFQWRNGEALTEYLITHQSDVADELADVLYWVLLMSHDLGIDIGQAFERKLVKNGEKYPVEKSKGSAVKYTEL
ncbi:TPA: nucleotide pyrophosphohydrolase [Candidatus Uhrbacteria bacterium]|nr:nucleotide pyrophosphohydrolase [Candidatus Uhrbacteria bacterium]